MKKSELIALAIAGVAVYMLFTAKQKRAVTSADGPIPAYGQTAAERAYALSLGDFAG
jgi:hypothetical protein